MDTTSLRLASAMRRLASSSPSAMRLARSCSSSGVSRGTLPISLRYMRTGSSVEKVSASASVSAAISSSVTSSISCSSSSSGRASSSSGGSRSSPAVSMPRSSSLS